MTKLYFVVLIAFGISGCTYDTLEKDESQYPTEVAKIITTKCATPGCHNTTSKDAAAGLDLSSWDAMFVGTNNGAVTIPGRIDFSTLLYFTNTDSTQGIVQAPTMPINEPPLTQSEYATLKNWIANGAPDKNGFVKFSDNPSRHKFYVANQGCDVVSVFDGDQKVIMRMVDVGAIPGASPAESPHNLKFAPNGKFWVAIYLNGSNLQTFNAETDQLEKTIPIGGGQWNTVVISNDSKKAYAVDYSGGRIAFVDLVAGTSTLQGPFPVTGSSAPNLHGIALTKNSDTLYVTCQEISKILKIPVNDVSGYQDINLFPFGGAPATPLKPHEIVFTPDYSKYIVTCQNSNEVRVMDVHTDAFITAIPVGKYPLEIAISQSRNLAFITNEEDDFFAGMRGSVSVIDLSNNTELMKIKVGWQPHGIVVDEKKKVVYVANRNVSGGIAPHHSSACIGTNGYLSEIDLQTLVRNPSFKPELSVDPYAITIRP